MSTKIAQLPASSLEADVADQNGGRSSSAVAPSVATSSVAAKYLTVRQISESLCATLQKEDYVVQSMPDVSPTKWHLAHTSWFFETFLLRPYRPDYRPFHPSFEYLFNSYYNAVGPQFYRPRRGVLSRPTVDEVYSYRSYVDGHMMQLIDEIETASACASASAFAHPSTPHSGPALGDGEIAFNQAQCISATDTEMSGSSGNRNLPDTALGNPYDHKQALCERIILGLNHEQQHQELMLMDIKHVFWSNPLRPALLRDAARMSEHPTPELRWIQGPEGVCEIGHAGTGFSYDNERPRHRLLAGPFAIASRCVTNAEYLEFIQDNGYGRSELWLSDGWATIQDQRWCAPLYWEQRDGAWYEMTLGGMRPLDPHAPVAHVSHYEADAYARWKGVRLPTEAEWEVIAHRIPRHGNFLESGRLQPVSPSPDQQAPAQLFGDVWEWTSSAYLPYPGFRPAAGAVGEYNGKFMSGQMVLRGGSCVTPAAHIRATYRNFFPPQSRWPVTGIRLTRDL